MTIHTVIKYIVVQTTISNETVPAVVYIDSSETSFIDYDDAKAYKDYIESVQLSGEGVELYEKEIKSKGELDLDALIFEEIKKKLTAKELEVITNNI